MKIIMICGQGSVGKSTFVKRYFSNKQNIINIRVDDIVNGDSFSLKYYDLYIQEI
jgi:GTPase SAR1 family protein